MFNAFAQKAIDNKTYNRRQRRDFKLSAMRYHKQLEAQAKNPRPGPACITAADIERQVVEAFERGEFKE
jgi:hypothetical protein